MFRRKTEPTEPENSTDREIYYPEITVLLEDLMRGSFVSFPILEEVNVVQIRELENAARELAQSYESQAIAETDAYRKHAARAAARYYDVVARIASEVAKYKTLIVKSRGKVLRDDIVPLGLITYAELPYTKLKAIEGSPYLEWPRSRYLEETGHMCADTANCENRLALLKVELAKFPGRQVNEYLTALALPLDSWLRPLDKGSDSFASVEQSQTSNSPTGHQVSQAKLKLEGFKRRAAEEWRRMHPGNYKLTRDVEDKGYREMGPVLDETGMTPMQVFPKGIKLGDVIREFPDEGKCITTFVQLCSIITEQGPGLRKLRRDLRTRFRRQLSDWSREYPAEAED